MPKTILAGFMSCTPAKPLPEDLETFIQESEHGVIFVSFGSVLQASKMPEHKRKMMLNVFAGLKQKVIWKWEVPMPDAPENVLISSWLPQTSLLAHSNVVMFVTHGGAGSYQETICHRTPLVGVNISNNYRTLGLDSPLFPQTPPQTPLPPTPRGNIFLCISGRIGPF